MSNLQVLTNQLHPIRGENACFQTIFQVDGAHSTLLDHFQTDVRVVVLVFCRVELKNFPDGTLNIASDAIVCLGDELFVVIAPHNLVGFALDFARKEMITQLLRRDHFIVIIDDEFASSETVLDNKFLALANKNLSFFWGLWRENG